MAEEEDKAPEADKEPQGKSSKGLVVVVLLVAVVLGGGAAAAGAIVAIRFGAPSAHGEPAPSASAEEEKVLGTLEFQPIVVDVRSGDGASHHLKVALSAEVPAEVVKEELTSLMPRGREAAISYLRTLTYEEATSPQRFDTIKGELSKRVVEAMGQKRIASILVTDFVSQ